MKGKFFILLTLASGVAALVLWARRTRSTVALQTGRVGLALFCRAAAKLKRQILLRGALWTAGLTALQWAASHVAKNRF